ncbi:hypothetical protein [Pseudomonas migulae]|uniref:Uncharacterized protein n=1 Tax=Pseudomonas migulae TaxID=78543 RepID=A0ABY8MYG5_9PSED|nr:hypothetical protein [Pseudomonas migulae]WGK91621.1 hypothetical protein MOQ58_05370 [Pseudomonas migulae]
MATKNSIYISDSNGKEILEGGTAPAGSVDFSGTTEANKNVNVSVGVRTFDAESPDGKLPMTGIPLAKGVYTARYKFDHLEEEKRRSFTLT